jgi:hypothetical protein
MIRRTFLFPLLCCAVLFYARPADAQVEGQACEAEPTDQVLSYGDTVYPCHIDPVGDFDLYRFQGSAGEVVVVRVVDISGTGNIPSCALQLTRPDATVVGSTANTVLCEIRATLDATGLFTARVTESGNNHLMSYSLQVDRLAPNFSAPAALNPGDTLTNQKIDPFGDTDLIMFNGASGDNITFTVTDQAGDSTIPACVLEVYRPDGTQVVSVSDNEVCVLNTTLDQTGVFAARVSELGDNNIMTYTIDYQCVGNCPSYHSLSVAVVGAGTVTSSPAGISCGADCFEPYLSGTVVTLTATPDPGASFTSWSGAADCADGVVTVSGALSCTANFTLSTFAPASVDDAFGTGLNTPLVIPAPGVLSNDNSNGGGPMSAALASAASNGAVTLNANGGFTYTPNVGFAGVDTFTYRASNSNGPGNVATVNITVSAVPSPTAVNDAFNVLVNAQLNAAAPGVLANDNSNGGGAMTAVLVTTTSHGDLALGADGSFTYQPSANFVGLDSFTYRATNAGGVSDVATVTINVLDTTTPQPPTGLIVDSVEGSLVRLRFTAPLLGPPPTGYVLRGGLVPGEVLAALPTGHTAPIFTFVAPTGSFFIRMHTVTASGESGPSNEIPLHVGVPVPPSAPQGLLGMVNGSAVALAWKNTFGGGAPTNSILDVTGSLNASLPVGLAESFTFPAVPPGTYTVRVRSSNAAGVSPPSDPVTLAFPGACLGPPVEPEHFLAYRIGNTIFVVWDPPASGPAPTEYVLDVSGAFVGAFSTGGRRLSGTVGPGTYNLSVRAVNPCGSSPATAAQAVSVP